MEIYHKLYLAVLFVLATVATLASVVVAKTELIANGTFDTDTSAWYNLGSTVGSISYIGSEGNTATGAANVQNLSTSSKTTSNGGAQCVSLSLPISSYYTVEGWVKVPTQSNSTAVGYIRLGFYSSTDCSGTQLDIFDTNTVGVGSDWTFVSKTVDTSSVSAAQSVEIRLYVRKTGSASANSYFDDISLFPSSATAVTLSSLVARRKHAGARLQGLLSAPFRFPRAALLGAGLSVIAAGIAALRRRPS